MPTVSTVPEQLMARLAGVQYPGKPNKLSQDYCCACFEINFSDRVGRWLLLLLLSLRNLTGTQNTIKSSMNKRFSEYFERRQVSKHSQTP